MDNTSFNWPSITVIPFDVYNSTGIKELQKEYDIKHTYGAPRIKITSDDFDWSTSNMTDIYLKTLNRPPFVKGCTIYTAKFPKCNWKTSYTQYGVKETMTPPQSHTIHDTMDFTLNTSICHNYIIQFHPSTDRYFTPHYTSLQFIVSRQQDIQVTISVEEFNRISTRADPCVEDYHYSQVKCWDEKIIQYKVMKAKCYFPGVTGYPVTGEYPECSNTSAYHNFMKWSTQITRKPHAFPDLQEMKAKCHKPCHTKQYFVTDKVLKLDRKKSWLYMRIHLDPRVINYISINEARAMPFDMLVGNVGGVLGLFLGISCISLFSSIKYFIGNLPMLMEKINNFSQTARI